MMAMAMAMCGLIRGETSQIQNAARCLIFVKLEQRRKMKHIQTNSEFGFVLYFTMHNTPKFKHASPHASRLASTPRHCANIAELCQADAHVTLLLRTLKFAL
jgi:hypothetical protein